MDSSNKAEDWREWCTVGSIMTLPNSQCEADEGFKVTMEFREFEPYVRQRLEYILGSGRTEELREEVEELLDCLPLMKDIMLDRTLGEESLRTKINKLYGMKLKQPIPMKLNNLEEYSNPGKMKSYLELKIMEALHLPHSRAQKDDSPNMPFREHETKSSGSSWLDWDNDKSDVKLLPSSVNNEKGQFIKVDPISSANLSHLVERRRESFQQFDKNTRPPPQLEERNTFLHGEEIATSYMKLPDWMQNEPDRQATGRTRSDRDHAVLRNPIPITSTHIPGYGQIDIMPPLQYGSTTGQTPVPSPFQRYEFECPRPREVVPNPVYDPMSPTPSQSPPLYPQRYYPRRGSTTRVSFPHYYKRGRGSLGAHCHGFGRHRNTLDTSPMVVAPPVNSFPLSSSGSFNNCNEQELFTEDDAFSSFSVRQQSMVRNKSAEPYSKSEYAMERGPITLTKSTSSVINKTRSQLKSKLEKECSGIYKLGFKQKGEIVVKDSVSVRSSGDEETASSTQPPPSSQKKDQAFEDAKEIILSLVNKKQRTEFLKSPDKLREFYDSLKAGNAAKRKTQKPKTKENLTKKNLRLQGKIKAGGGKVKLTLQELRNALMDSTSEESDVSGAARSISTTRTETATIMKKPSVNKAIKKTNKSAPKFQSTQAGKKKEKPKSKSPEKSPPRQRKRNRILSDTSDSEEEDNLEETANDVKEDQQKVEGAGRKISTQQAVTIIRNENLQKRKKVNDTNEEKRIQRTFSNRVTTEGRTVVGPNDVFVNTSVNKISLGGELDEVAGDSIGSVKIDKQEIKEEEFDNLTEDEFMSFVLSKVEVEIQCIKEEDNANNVQEGDCENETGVPANANGEDCTDDNGTERQIGDEIPNGGADETERILETNADTVEQIDDSEDFESDFPLVIKSVQGSAST